MQDAIVESLDFSQTFVGFDREDHVPSGDRFDEGLEWLLDGFAAKLGL